MNLYLPAFYLGVAEELEKAAATDISSMPVNENILPTMSNQGKWKYVRTKDGLKLSDGNLVYSFNGFPESYPSEDTQVTRGEDDNLLNFDKDGVSKGTAQIHRSSLDNVYMTLSDGTHNPTFMLQHEHGKNWRYSPSKKFLEKLKRLEAEKNNSVEVDPSALIDGASDGVKLAYLEPDMITGALDSVAAADLLKGLGSGLGTLGHNFVDMHVKYPITTTLGGYVGGKTFARALDKINPSREIKRAIDPLERTRREVSPLLGSALTTLGAHAFV